MPVSEDARRDEPADRRPEPDEGRMRAPHDHATAAGSPGASGPGDPAYEGEATIGDEGAAAGPEAFTEPFGRPDTTPDP